ncbi:MAG TPA: hypothetical protein VJ438_00980 [Candidatus Nanoarchaeia archaeon]|nr:hypothetical protein [Candidatus Nanoarchaeia archaeon]
MDIKKWFWIVYVIFALYLVNKALAYFTIPESLLVFEKWILIGAAVLLLLGAYNSFKSGKTPY